MVRRSGWRVVKIHRTYTVEEAASNQGVAKGTVRRWLKDGLHSLQDRKPCLILGSEFADFLKNRKKPKKTCKPEECYCFSCKAPRPAAFAEAEYKPRNSTHGRLVALCAVCATVMNKSVPLAAIGPLSGKLQVTVKQVSQPIGKGEEASLNDH